MLASGSPRRRDVLRDLGFDPEVIVPDVDESPIAGEDPISYVARVAEVKAAAVAERLDPDREWVVLAADTTVELDGRILAKPDDAGHARAMLAELSGRTHLVHTGVAVRTGPLPGRSGPGRARVVVVTSQVEFAVLDESDVNRYVDSGEPFGKAGGYAIQGIGGTLVRAVRGSVTNVVGLPAVEVRELLRSCGFSC